VEVEQHRRFFLRVDGIEVAQGEKDDEMPVSQRDGPSKVKSRDFLGFGATIRRPGLTIKRFSPSAEKKRRFKRPIPKMYNAVGNPLGSVRASRFEGRLAVSTQKDLLFGALAVKKDLATESEIDLALEAQKGADSPARIGEILVEMGTLRPEQIDELLAEQKKLRATNGGSEASAPAAPSAPPRQGVRLTLESGGTLTVNDVPLSAPHLLKSGDRLRVGEAVLRFESDAGDAPPVEVLRARPAAEPEMAAAEFSAEPKGSAASPAPSAPPAAASSDTAAVPAAAPQAEAPKKSFLETIKPILQGIDRGITKVLPKVHNQRKYIVAAAVLGFLAFILPWRVAKNGITVLGIQGPGWFNLLLLSVPLGAAVLTRVALPFAKIERIVAGSFAGLGVLVVVWKLVSLPAWAAGRGIGIWLMLFSSLAVLAATWLARPAAAEAGGGAQEPTGGARLWKKALELFGAISGRAAKEKNAAIQKRDDLLQKVGEAAWGAKVDGPEGEAAGKAKEAVTEAQKQATDEKDATESVKARAALKAAEAKAKRALMKLGRHVLDKGIAVEGQEPHLAEIRALDEKIKSLP